MCSERWAGGGGWDGDFHQLMSQTPPAAAVIAHPSQNNTLGCERRQPTALSPEDGVAAETGRGTQISIANQCYSGPEKSRDHRGK